MKYERFGKIEVAKASKEVILSAGAIGSPKILLLSGVGPEEELTKLNVSELQPHSHFDILIGTIK